MNNNLLTSVMRVKKNADKLKKVDYSNSPTNWRGI